MADSIGTVPFIYPLWHIDKHVPVVVGQDSRVRNGEMVMVRVENPSQKQRTAHVGFEWTCLADVNKLYAMCKAGGIYPAVIDNVSYNVCFAAENGVTNVKNEVWGDETVHHYLTGAATDIYRGEMNLIILT